MIVYLAVSVGVCGLFIILGIFMVVVGSSKDIDSLGVMGIMIIVISLIAGLIACPITAIAWKTCEQEAKIINQTYGTNYTTYEMFWGGEIVKNYVYGDKKNYNITVKGLK